MSGRAVAIIQARMTSTRLPGKVLLPLAGAPLVARVIERARRIPGIDAVCLAIPEGAAHAALGDLARAAGAAVAVGPEDDVLARYHIAARATAAEIVMRVTSDCPFIDPAASGTVLAMLRAGGVPYARTAIKTGYPIGLDTEVMRADTLAAAARESADPFEREHVTPFIWRQPERFPFLMLDRVPDRRAWRLTVDTAADYTLAHRLYEVLHPADPDFDFAAIENLMLAQPDLASINADIPHTPHLGWRAG